MRFGFTSSIDSELFSVATCERGDKVFSVVEFVALTLSSVTLADFFLGILFHSTILLMRSEELEVRNEIIPHSSFLIPNYF